MIITVKLFATLNRFAPDQHQAGEPFNVEIPEGSTIRDLFEVLGIPEREVKVAFVNGQARAGVFRLNAGNEVRIFPPVGGG
ncbi:MAG: MoaD/ThiS family protein [Anaerolineae bacterium]|nr:MoaD/ThiS family protein [Anaerolineae bacterium]